MKKRILLSVLLVAATGTVLYINSKDKERERYRELVSNHPIQERLKLSKKERKKKGYPPNRYFDDQYLLEMDPSTGKTYPEHLEDIKKTERTKGQTRFAVVPGLENTNPWVERGPDNIGGRTRVVFYDPNDASGKRVFAGGVSGGLWVNNDISNPNSSWTRVGIDENLSVSCYAIDPNDSNVWYIGTGEAYTGNDGTGNGIWRTTNGGNTWTQFLVEDLFTFRDTTRDDFEILRFYYINEIVAWNNAGTTEIFFSVDGGVDYDPVGYALSGWWKFNGATPGSIPFFTPDIDPDPEEENRTPYVFSDVEIAPDNSLWCATKTNLFGRGGGKIFRTTDGENFTEKYSFTSGNRVELSVSKTNPNKVYALAQVPSGVSLVKTTDGTNFGLIAKPNDVDDDIEPDDFARNQAFYNLTIEVDPENDDIVYAGGIDLFRSSNGGGSWKQISKWSNNNSLADLDVSQVHADQHAIIFDPNDSNKGVFANDGGIYYASNLSNAALSETAIVARNKNYNITQFYSGAIGQDVNNEMILGGTQDNGSLLVLNADAGVNSYFDIYGGDGIENFIDKDNEYLVVSYVHNVYGAYLLPITNESRSIEISDDQDSGSFSNTADLDHNLDILYTNGTEDGTPRISRFKNLTTTPVRKNFTSAKLDESPSVIRVSPYTINSSTVFVGTVSGKIIKVTGLDGEDPVWTDIDIDSEINVGAVSDIDFGRNEDEILVTMHNYGINNIYYSSDGGETWEEKEGNFPDIPVKAIQMNPFDVNEVIIGTNLGVWSTQNFTNDAPTWEHAQNGMSNVKVTKFDMRVADTTVLASTYGRGLFTGSFSESLFLPNNPIENKEALTYKVSLNSTFIDNDRLEVGLKNISGDTSFIIYNAKGKTIQKERLNSNNGRVQYIPVEGYKPGVYFLFVAHQGSSYTKRFIVK
ncbi:T9SS type A sorting domain-containing protein [Wenyingzhuangia sp. IMCC45574]